MLRLLRSLLSGTISVLRDRRDLALENLALRQQERSQVTWAFGRAVFKQSTKRPRLSKADRAFWVLLSRTWSGWKEALLIVKPETVIAWHRKGFRLYWTWRSRRRVGRQPFAPSTADRGVPGATGRSATRAEVGPRESTSGLKRSSGSGG